VVPGVSVPGVSKLAATQKSHSIMMMMVMMMMMMMIKLFNRRGVTLWFNRR